MTDANATLPTGPVTGRLSRLAIWAAILTLVIVLLPMLLFRLGFGFQFMLLMVGFFVSIAAVALAVAALVRAFMKSQRKATPLLALVTSGIVAVLMLGLASAGRSAPPIHDITTDTNNPPAFVAAVAEREGSTNPVDYDPAVAAQQQEAYADIRTLTLPSTTPGEAFRRAQDLIQARGWDLIEANAAEGRLEATATSRWFGFKDDVVLRIQPDGAGGSLVDMRSKSRMGRSDLGANAARIRSFLGDLQAG